MALGGLFKLANLNMPSGIAIFDSAGIGESPRVPIGRLRFPLPADRESPSNASRPMLEDIYKHRLRAVVEVIPVGAGADPVVVRGGCGTTHNIATQAESRAPTRLLERN